MNKKGLMLGSEKFPGRNFHHIRARARGGGNRPRNKLLIKVDRHFYWHELFGLKTIDEVIKLLIRVQRAKKHQPRRKKR